MINNQKISVGIVGGTGYTAGELLRILVSHPAVNLSFVTARDHIGEPISDVHRDLLGETNLKFVEKPQSADVIFLCLPHGESRRLLENDVDHLFEQTKIIDLGNDFRVDSHCAGRTFVYGLSEFNRFAISRAEHIANPGCFATAIQLGLLPIVNFAAIDEAYVVGITGATGAGKTLQETTAFSWRNNNISTYKTFTHQHLAEIDKSLSDKGRTSTTINFVPWRGDFARGIFTTIMYKSQYDLDELREIYRDAYRESPFVFVSSEPVDLKLVVNTNRAMLSIEKVDNQVAVHVAIDNLLKGASGQAVQNMNLMFGLNEKTGLNLKPSVF